MRFLHAADLHLDSPLRGLDRYPGAPVERLRGATRRALEWLVDRALAEPVDFVLLAGDVYDRDWQDFHTGLFFREQMVRLDRAGIPVFMVQGNHDAQGVISRQLPLPANCHVFSSRAAQTERLDGLACAIHGRSFRDRVEDADLVPSYPDPVPGWFNIGLLHTSLTGRAGHDPYAPTDLAALTAKGYDYWALGHVHARELVAESPRIVFPGNLQGRHANETGPKGCELVSVSAGRIEAEFVPLDSVRWGQVTLDLDGIDRLEGLAEPFRAGLAPLLAGAGDRLHAVRVNLRGCTPLHQTGGQPPRDPGGGHPRRGPGPDGGRGLGRAGPPGPAHPPGPGPGRRAPGRGRRADPAGGCPGGGPGRPGRPGAGRARPPAQGHARGAGGTTMVCRRLDRRMPWRPCCGMPRPRSWPGWRRGPGREPARGSAAGQAERTTMRLARLLLRAFGPFTDAELDLGRADPSRPDLHLIYGPNEAGKSSALRAMTDLRFGIPQRSPDDFRTPSARCASAGSSRTSRGTPSG